MQVLTQELNRVTNQIEQLSFYKDKLRSLISASEPEATAPQVKVTVQKTKQKRSPAIPSDKLRQIAATVAQKVRDENVNKKQAIESSLAEYGIRRSKVTMQRLQSAITPSTLGAEWWSEHFAGTKYVK